MYNPDTLSKMAEQKRHDIHRNEAQRRLAKDSQFKAGQSGASIVQKVIGFVQRFTEKAQQTPTVTHLENVETKT